MLNKKIIVANEDKYVSSIAIADNEVFHITTQFLRFRPNGRKAKKRMKQNSCFVSHNQDGSYTIGVQCVINAQILMTMLSMLRKNENGELYFAEDKE